MQHEIPSENYYQLLFEVTPFPLVIFDLHNYQILDVNPAAVALYGYAREEFLQKTVSDFLLPDDVARLNRRLAADPLGPRQRLFGRHRKKNGELFNVEVNDYIINLQGKYARLVIINDVTAQLAYERELSSAREFYKLLFEKSPIPGWVYEQESLRFLDVNQAAIEKYGYTREEFLRMKITDIRPPEEIERLLKEIDKALPNEKIDRVWLHRKKDGTKITVEVGVHPITFNERNAVIVSAQDITARSEMELALRESEAHYRTLYEKANDTFYAIDVEGRLTSLNEYGEKYLGYTRAEILGKHVRKIVPEEDWPFVEPILAQVFSGTVPSNVYELRLLAKDGRYLPTEVSANAIYQNDQVSGIQGIARDLRRRNYLEQQLRESQKMEAIGRLAGRLAHDFNNLLTVVQGYSTLLLRRTPREDARYNLIEQIQLAGESAADLTSKLLVLGRQQVAQLQVLDINDAVLRMGNILRSALGENIEFDLALAAVDGFVKVDNTQLDHVLMNLVLNARDAMPKGGQLTIMTTTEEVSEAQTFSHENIPAGNYVRLTVNDTGMGMNADTLSHLFEPFFTTKEKGKGTGLGLFNVQKLMKQFGGYIHVATALGAGSALHLYFPQVAAPLIAPALAHTQIASTLRTGAILLVEDEEAVRKLITEFLRELGFQVFVAPNGAAALALVATLTQPIDLVLTDLRMPKMNGRELAEKLRTQLPALPVLFMSGYTDDAEFPLALTGQRTGFLQKPFTTETLLEKIQVLLQAE